MHEKAIINIYTAISAKTVNNQPSPYRLFKGLRSFRAGDPSIGTISDRRGIKAAEIVPIEMISKSNNWIGHDH